MCKYTPSFVHISDYITWILGEFHVPAAYRFIYATSLAYYHPTMFFNKSREFVTE